MATSQTVISQNIRAVMTSKNITQTTLAEALGLTQQALSGKLSGQRKISVDELTRIASALAVPAADLLNSAALADSEVA